MTDTCSQCGNEYKEIGIHWSQSSNCTYPPFSQHQREIITGLLMGDGSIDRHVHRENANPELQSKMVSQNYLMYVDREFGVFGNGVSLAETAAEAAERDRESGFRTNAKAENYHDIYMWRCMVHPELQEFAGWYVTGEKVWPNNINVTPTVLKHWYCGDGNCSNRGSSSRIQIAMANEIENTDKISKMFVYSGLPAPSNYNIQQRKDGSKRCTAQFTVDQSQELWEYMGEPLPDFEYKWPDKYHS